MQTAHETTIKAISQTPKPTLRRKIPRKSFAIKSIGKLRHMITTWRKTEKLLMDPNHQNDETKQATIRSNLATITYFSMKYSTLPPCPWGDLYSAKYPEITTETLPTWRKWTKYLYSTTHAISYSQDLHPTYKKVLLKSYDSSPQRKPLPLLKAQKKLSNKSIDGPIDGIYSDTKRQWIIDTEELQETITEKTTRMYKRHWFARITNKILWVTTFENGIPRTNMRTKEDFLRHTCRSIRNLRELSTLLDLTNDTDYIIQGDISKIRQLAIETSLELPSELTNDDTASIKNTNEIKKWILERKIEINLIIQLMEDYIQPAWDTLQPVEPTPIMKERINWVLQKLTTKEEVRELFMSMKRNKTSGPTGWCAEHYANAPPRNLGRITPNY
jgi:hypothetical protein